MYKIPKLLGKAKSRVTKTEGVIPCEGAERLKQQHGCDMLR
nr:MAG TPA: Protein of unknown function (DUF2786) [Caudoviricetes sp.]